MPSLLERLAAPSCPKIGSQWDRYVDRMEGPPSEEPGANVLVAIFAESEGPGAYLLQE
jgi:hypothetical protein